MNLEDTVAFVEASVIGSAKTTKTTEQVMPPSPLEERKTSSSI
jgi:hypothetical protein